MWCGMATWVCKKFDGAGLLLALIFSLYGGVLLLSLVLDIWGGYAMCELCVAQRCVVLANALMAGLALREEKNARLLWICTLFVGMLVGLWIGVWHSALLKNQIATASCAMVAQASLLPTWFFDCLSCFYTFMPCASSVKTFLGMTFSAWSIILHLSALGILGCLLACV